MNETEREQGYHKTLLKPTDIGLVVTVTVTEMEGDGYMVAVGRLMAYSYNDNSYSVNFRDVAQPLLVNNLKEYTLDIKVAQYGEF